MVTVVFCMVLYVLKSHETLHAKSLARDEKAKLHKICLLQICCIFVQIRPSPPLYIARLCKSHICNRFAPGQVRFFIQCEYMRCSYMMQLCFSLPLLMPWHNSLKLQFEQVSATWSLFGTFLFQPFTTLFSPLPLFFNFTLMSSKKPTNIFTYQHLLGTRKYGFFNSLPETVY